MKILLAIAAMAIFLFLSPQSASAGGSFKQYPRVREAYTLKEGVLKKLFEEKKLQYPPKQIFFRIFKVERKFEVWVQQKKKEKYVLLKTYQISPAFHIRLGPKRRRGDLHIPEGFYHVTSFNPISSFCLSLGIDYPNEVDRALGDKKNLGGDIFIHGGVASFGCIPVGDAIEEIYLLAMEARNAGQKNISVHIFPARLLMEKDGLEIVTPEFDQALIEFWKNLREGYRFFEIQKLLPRVEVKNKKYVFQKPKS